MGGSVKVSFTLVGGATEVSLLLVGGRRAKSTENNILLIGGSVKVSFTLVGGATEVSLALVGRAAEINRFCVVGVCKVYWVEEGASREIVFKL